MFVHTWLRFRGGVFLTLMAALIAMPVVAEEANFATLTLEPGFSSSAGKVRGHTGGSYSLSAITNSDRSKNRCLGFGDTTPDHIMVLGKGFSKLTLQVDSQGYDTTLLVQGPDGVRCGDDTGANKDASVTDSNWQAGTYRIWVGAFEPGVGKKYKLSASE